MKMNLKKERHIYHSFFSYLINTQIKNAALHRHKDYGEKSLVYPRRFGL